MSHGTTIKTSPRIEPLLYFDRQCEKAIELYVKAFDAKLTFLMRFSDIPEKDWPLNFDANKDLQLIYHAQIKIGNQRILLCDNLFNDLPRGHSASFVVMFNNADEIMPVYDILADGATILSSSDNEENNGGPIVDKFGIHWDLIVYND